MRETLGDRVLGEFLQLAEAHRDGWGMVSASSGSLSSHVSSRSALLDAATFGALTAQSIDSAIVHERWASPGIDLALDNQQPFSSAGVGFAHNGTIGNDRGNIVRMPASYRESLGLVHSTTTSDSRIYADLFFLQLAELRRTRQGRQSPEGNSGDDEVRRALALTIARLRQDYPDASFNCVIETADFTFAARAHADNPQYSEWLRRRYKELGWADRIENYYELAYATLPHADGSTTSVVSSSGYASSDPWAKLGNNAILAISHRDAALRMMSLEA